MRIARQIALIGALIFGAILLLHINSHSVTYSLAVDGVLRAIGDRRVAPLLLPDKDTTFIQPRHFCKDENERPLSLLFLVNSSPENREQRAVLRETLGTALSSSRGILLEGTGLDGPIGLLFFVGIPQDRLIRNELGDEAKETGDLVVEDFVENYLNLTVKTLRMLKWWERHCSGSRFLVKIDDDVLLNPRQFLLRLAELGASDRDLIAGHLYPEASIDENPASKWFVPSQIWPRLTLPPFVGGFLYVLGSGAASKLFQQSINTPLFHLEDVYLTGMVAEGAGLPVLGMPGINKYWTIADSVTFTDCGLASLTAVHPATPSQIRCWTRLLYKKCYGLPLFLLC